MYFDSQLVVTNLKVNALRRVISQQYGVVSWVTFSLTGVTSGVINQSQSNRLKTTVTVQYRRPILNRPCPFLPCR